MSKIFQVSTILLCCIVSSNFSEIILNHKTDDNYGICTRKQPCIRKCCPENHYLRRKVCIETANQTIQFPIHEGIEEIVDENVEFSVIHERICRNHGTIIRLAPKLYSDDVYFIQTNGDLYLPNTTTQKNWLNFTEFCIDTALRKGTFEFVVLICGADILDEPETAYSFGMIISMPFLLATFIAYALLPDRNLHMKALMSYVINLMFGYLLLVIIQLSKTQFSVASCKSLGYFCLFFFMVSFFWMNVICIDIWFGFSGYRGFSGSKSAERKRFLLYCAYAWGMSILHILTVLLIDSVSNPSSWYAPGIGNGQCFIKTGWAELLYFYGPMGILITINVTLFVITAFKIRSLKKDTAMLKKDDSKRHSYENDKQKFNLYVKLLFAMGVNWSMEIISWAVIWNYKDLSTYIWYLTDFCNAAYGVFIFFIFVFKKNIWKLLQKRYYSFIGKPHLAHSVGQTQTRTTSYSTANTSLHETTNHHPGGGGGGSHITETSVLTTEA